MSIRTRLALIDLCIGSGFKDLEPAQALCACAPAIVTEALSHCEDGLSMEGIFRATGLNAASIRYAVRQLCHDGIIVQADPGILALSDTKLMNRPGFPDDVWRCIAGNGYVTRGAAAGELGATEDDVRLAVYALRIDGIDIRQFETDGDVVYWEARR